MENLNFWNKWQGLTRLPKCKFAAFLKGCSYSQKSLQFLSLFLSLFLVAFCIKTKAGKISIFDKNHELTPLEKIQLLGLFSIDAFIELFLELHQRVFLDAFCIRNKRWKNLNFWQKPWTNPFGKMQILELF